MKHNQGVLIKHWFTSRFGLYSQLCSDTSPDCTDEEVFGSHSFKSMLFKLFIDFCWIYSGEKSYSRVHQLRLWCHCRFSLITVEQEYPSSKPADVLGICPSSLSSMSLQGWMKHSKDVLYFLLIRFEAGQSKTLRACKLLLALGSFHCSVCIAPCHTAAAASTWMTQEAAK